MRFATLLLCLAACGGSGGASGPATLQLSASGISPNSVTIPSGGQVRFVNGDTADHQIASTTCTELSSPRLAAGQEFLVQPLTGPRNCTYNDSLNPSAAGFQGTVVVSAPGGGGGGGGGSGY